MRKLTGPELEAARNALVDGYVDYGRLEQLAAFVLDINLEAEVGTGGLKRVAFDLLKLTEAEGWTEILLREAASRKPGNEALRSIAARLGLAPAPYNNVTRAPTPAAQAVPAGGGYEAIVLKAAGIEKTGEWRERMVGCEQKVCQILYDGKAVGTGFLVGPNLVMSNWHVFEQPAEGGRLGELARFAARFDFRGAEGEGVSSLGTTISIDAAAGYRDHSHKVELDYVVVELTQRIGDEIQAGGNPRGFLTLGTRDFAPNEPTLVLQHPKGRTLELAIGYVAGWLPTREREIYEHFANTEEGSSGSPCFSCAWSLFALHHRGGTAKNRAIATTAILGRMGSVGTIGMLPAV